MSVDEYLLPGPLGFALTNVTGDDRWHSFEARLISGGKSNLTFELSSEAGSLILRRPPTSGVLPSAHDMGREARIQKALWDTPVPVAEVLMVDSIGELMGFPFYIMKKVCGYVIRGEIPDGFAVSSTEKLALADVLIDVLINMHQIDYESIGLGDFGRPIGFLERQLLRWTTQWELTKTFELKAIDELAVRLHKFVPPLLRPSIVHGDYRLDNCMMSAKSPSVMNAVLDWELSTIGDPISDLGLTLLFWREPGDISLTLIPSVSSEQGFPSRDYLAERYSVNADVDLGDMDFYNAFARFKYAIIAQGVLRRELDGAMAGQRFGDLRQEIEAIADEGLEYARKEG